MLALIFALSLLAQNPDDGANNSAPPAGHAPSPIATSVAAPASAPATSAPTNGEPVATPLSLRDQASGTQRAAILAKDLEDLGAMMVGGWDNDAQVFFAPEIGIAESQRPAHVNVSIQRLNPAVWTTPSFLVIQRAGGDRGASERVQVWQLSANLDADGVAMTTSNLADANLNGTIAPIGGVINSEAIAALTPAQLSHQGQCGLIWRRRAGGFSADTPVGGCRIAAPSGTITLSEHHEIGPDSWDVRDIGVNGEGRRVFGSPDIPTRFDRITQFVCWASFPNGNEWTVRDNIRIHDRGGEAMVEGGHMRIRLRQIRWPYGTNRPSLTLYILPETGEQAFGYGWGEPDSTRIALNVGDRQASCTRQTDQ